MAVAYGQTAIASTEHGKPLNWVAKKLYCKSKGIKFLHGVEIYLTEQLEPKVRDNYHTILIAKNYAGFKELNALVSMSTDEAHTYYTNRISFDEFLNISDNIISTSACLASPLNKLDEDHPMYMKLAQKYDYLEVQPHNCEDQRLYNQRLFKLAQKIGKPLIAATDTHSSTQYKADCRRILLKSKHKSYGDEDTFNLTYRSYDELVSEFREQGVLTEDVFLDAIENTVSLANSVEDFDIDTSIKYPILHGSQEKDETEFAHRVERMFQEKLDSGIIPPEQADAFRSAIDEEMRVFNKLHMGGFMLSMSELICWCKEHGMAIGTARGSVGGSRVAYITDIIDLNPEQWNTVFSRFCNEDREEIGDIDIDLIESDRPAVFKHIVERFGQNKTARVASYGTIAAKGAIDDIARALRQYYDEQDKSGKPNPWSLANTDKIKILYESDQEKARYKYSELFKYFDGLVGTRVSQSVHPAGMVISPITLPDNYGVFHKDGDICLMLDMDQVHDSGLAKYDFLILKTVQVIRDTCRAIGIPYPRTHQIDWNDQAVWEDMTRSPVGIFQFEGAYAYEMLKKYNTKSIFDMSMVTACIRPSGASYRDDLIAHKIHKNPSQLIDDLLKDNEGYLIYQEDIIKFLQQVCGLSGSEADNVRRGIARKKTEVLEKMMPKILDGYCNKSDKPRDVAEKEAQEFLQIIEDASAYMFGYNHSVAYCMLGYLCAYYRYYYPMEFITAFLNDAANDEDTQNGTKLAKAYGITISNPKFGLSKSHYVMTKEQRVIAKGLESVKYMSKKVANELFDLANNNTYQYFSDVLSDIYTLTSADTRQVDLLIKIGFFDAFGNQSELLRIAEMFEKFKRGEIKKLKKDDIAGSFIEPIIKKYSVDVNKDGSPAKSYTITDQWSVIHEVEDYIKSIGVEDLSTVVKVKNYCDIMGYSGYCSGKPEDRSKLFVKNVFPLNRKSDGKQFGYSVLTQSVGSGKESRFTVMNSVFKKEPIAKDDLILCTSFVREGQYFKLTGYKHIFI